MHREESVVGKRDESAARRGSTNESLAIGSPYKDGAKPRFDANSFLHSVITPYKPFVALMVSLRQRTRKIITASNLLSPQPDIRCRRSRPDRKLALSAGLSARGRRATPNTRSNSVVPRISAGALRPHSARNKPSAPLRGTTPPDRVPSLPPLPYRGRFYPDRRDEATACRRSLSRDARKGFSPCLSSPRAPRADFPPPDKHRG